MLTAALFAPVALVVCLVLAILKEDSPPVIVKTAFKNFGILSGILVAGCLLVFLLEKVL